MFNIVIRGLSLIIFCTLFGYWFLLSKKAQQEKPKTKKINLFVFILKSTSNWASLVIICIQIAGWNVFPISSSYAYLAQMIGFVLLIIGFSVSISARSALGANWVHGFEYQIKQKQTLITTGIYKYIRHPIYIGLFLVLIGAELIAQSLLFLSFLVMIFPFYIQAKREEKLLINYFGEAYKSYKRHTKMFIPFIW
ncbi:MAG TPA: isoprenylcysteine carboxylmethyltransferase family protein [Patescibacteria group bacterium]